MLALGVAALAWAVQSGRSALAPLGLFIGAWLVFGAATELWLRTGSSGWRRLFRLPRADWGKAVAHAGLGITFIGVAGLTAWQVEDIRVAQPGAAFEVDGFELELVEVQNVQGPNYISTMAEIILRDAPGGDELARLFPEKRIYPVAQMPTTEAAIDYRLWRDVYVVIGDQQQGGGWTVRTFIKPLANWIWAGCILMALGGFISLSDRRFRVAAGGRKTTPAKAVPAE